MLSVQSHEQEVAEKPYGGHLYRSYIISMAHFVCNFKARKFAVYCKTGLKF